MAFKVFTNGSVLQASEVNDNLMRQAVITFSNTAARTAAITAPSEGMLTYLEDVNRYDHWNGSAWVSPFGMTLLATASPSATASISINNVFSSFYQNYVILANLTGTAASVVDIRLRASGADATTNYVSQSLSASGATVSGARDTTSQSFVSGTVRTVGRSLVKIEVSNPFATLETSYFAFNQDPTLGAFFQMFCGSNSNATSYDGFTMRAPSGTMTGSIRVYGVRN